MHDLGCDTTYGSLNRKEKQSKPDWGGVQSARMYCSRSYVHQAEAGAGKRLEGLVHEPTICTACVALPNLESTIEVTRGHSHGMVHELLE